MQKERVMKYETVEQLVKRRKGYKYLLSNGESPYQGYKYILRKGKVFVCNDLNTNPHSDCGAGWNLATLPWILGSCDPIASTKIVEFSIPKDATIVVPDGTTGKFRTDKMVYERQHSPKDLFPQVFKILDQCKRYKPVNPIQAETLPPKRKILSIMEKIGWSVGDQVGAQVRAQVGDRVGDRVGEQVWEQVGERVRAQVGEQVWAQVREQVRDQVGDQVWEQVWEQVWDQVYICAYHAVAEFMKLKYNHPAFDLVRLGVMVIAVANKYKVFGKAGKFLGEYDVK